MVVPIHSFSVGGIVVSIAAFQFIASILIYVLMTLRFLALGLTSLRAIK